MSCFIHLMALHQDVQDKVYEELTHVFKTATEEVTDSHLDQLPYLEMTIRESLRFWAMVPISARTAMEDIQIGKKHFWKFYKISFEYLIFRTTHCTRWNCDHDSNISDTSREENLGSGCRCLQTREIRARRDRKSASLRVYSLPERITILYRSQVRHELDESHSVARV